MTIVSAQTMSMPAKLLRLEGAIVFMSAVAAYIALHGSLILFALLILAPDASMIGYLANPRAGSLIYNTVHIYLLPVALLAIGWIAGFPVGVQIALILLAHIGVDRAVGYGLKYPTEFKDTHLQHV